MTGYEEQSIKEKIFYINKHLKRKINIMEVCGTHTMAIGKFGIRSLFNENINLISGPGCPVCVTPDIYIDYLYNLSKNSNVIIATYGDMIRIPGSSPEIRLERARAEGAQIKIVYSSMDALNIALNNKDKKVIFPGIGFETTTPATAVALKEAKKGNVNNFYVLSMHKIMEPIMRLLLEDDEISIDGFLCPGHVAAILGEKGFEFLKEYDALGAVTGFEMNEIVEGIYSIVKGINDGFRGVTNCYRNVVAYEGNIIAQSIIHEVFILRDDYWRGMGMVPQSGLKINSFYEDFDIENIYPMDYSIKNKKINSGCRCGEVLSGKIKPNECKLFKVLCNPSNPIGPCMVSSEGSCAAYYRYENL